MDNLEFIRGSRTDYESLLIKDPNSLYFIKDEYNNLTLHLGDAEWSDDTIITNNFIERLKGYLPYNKGTFNSGNDCDEIGIYDYITLGRPSGDADEYYILITFSETLQIVISKKYSGRIFMRHDKNSPWISLQENLTMLQGIINITNSADIKNAQNKLTKLNEYQKYIITDENGKYPSSKKGIVVTPQLYQQMVFNSPQEALSIFLNGDGNGNNRFEAYYSMTIPIIGTKWFSQNISQYLLTGVEKYYKVGDFIEFVRVKVKAVDFLEQYVNFNEIDVTSKLSWAEQQVWNGYKRNYGVSTDGDCIKAMINDNKIFALNGVNNTYLPLCEDGYVEMYDTKVLTSDFPHYKGTYWSDACTQVGVYEYMTSGRGGMDSDSDEYYTLIVTQPSENVLRQDAYSSKYPEKIWCRFIRDGVIGQWVKTGSNEKIEQIIENDELAVSTALNSIKNNVGLNDELQYIPKSNTNYITNATSISEALEILDNVVKNNYDELKRLIINGATTLE